MSLKKVSKEQPDQFEFSDENLNLAKKIILNYPSGKKKSAVMALLYLAQKQNNNWIPLAAMKYIAKYLEISYINVSILLLKQELGRSILRIQLDILCLLNLKRE